MQDPSPADTAAAQEMPANLAEWRFLADINVALNALAFVLIVLGLIAIKQRKEGLHKVLMLSGAGASAVFLGCYLVFHYQVGSVKFTEEGAMRTLYLAILIPHIVLAAVQVPLIVGTIWLGLTDRREKHKKWARITAPIWLFVSLTGVVVYLLVYTYQGI